MTKATNYLIALMLASAAHAAPIVSVLADFEADDYLASAEELTASVASDWTIEPAAIPARGQRSLSITAASTRPDPSAIVRFRFRDPARFAQADRLMARAWLNQGSAAVAFVVEDALGRSFATEFAEVGGVRRWADLRSKLDRDALGKPRGQDPDAPPDIEPMRWPLEIVGVAVRFKGAGRHTLYLDDLEIEHDVPAGEIVRGSFFVDRMSAVVEAGAEARMIFSLENRSRADAVNGALELTLYGPTGEKLAEERRTVTLPPKGADYRSRQTFPFSKRLEYAGFCRVAARLTSGASPPVDWEFGLVALPPRPDIVRGRDQLFGVRVALFDQTPSDRLFEIEVAAALGAQVIALETPWRVIQPRPDTLALEQLDTLIKWMQDRRIEPLIVLTDPPEWLGAAEPGEHQAKLLTSLVGRFGRRVRHYQLAREPGDGAALAQAMARVRARVAPLLDDLVIISPAAPLGELTADADGALGAAVSGSPGACAAALSSGKFEKKASVFCVVDATPAQALGDVVDASDVLRAYVAAARGGVRTLVWGRLRDTPDAPGVGLLRRDFSPRRRAAAFANAAQWMIGAELSGPMPGAATIDPARPALADPMASALFISLDRQVGIVFDSPTVVPGVMARLLHGVSGFAVCRRWDAYPTIVFEWGDASLIEPPPGVMVVEFFPETNQSRPQVAFVPTWVAAPGVVAVDQTASFTARITCPYDAQRAYLRAETDPAAPIRCELGARVLQAGAGVTTEVEAPLKRVSALKDGTDLRLEVAIDSVRLPATVRLVRETPLRRQADATDIATAANALESRGRVFGAWRPTGLTLVMELGRARGPIRVGFATVGADESHPAVGAFAPGEKDVEWTAQPSGWQARAVDAKGARRVEISIPGSGLKAGDAVLLAVDGPMLELGQLEGPNGPLLDYVWLRLAE